MVERFVCLRVYPVIFHHAEYNVWMQIVMWAVPHTLFFLKPFLDSGNIVSLFLHFILCDWRRLCFCLYRCICSLLDEVGNRAYFLWLRFLIIVFVELL